MRIVYERAAVRVPATTANMGPGFDSFGMAFRYYDEVSVRPITGTTRVIVEGVGAETVPTDDDNLVVQALRAGLDAVGAPQAGFEMRCVNRIPHGGGMGSSAGAAVAGLMLARGLISEPEALSDDRIFALATDFEGPPDNVAPAVFGGATVSWMNEETSEVGSVRLTPPDDIHPVAFIPDFELRTAAARAALPATVPHGDASFNVARGALLAAVLSGNAQASGGVDLHSLLMEATRDRLHQEQRRAAMEPSLALVDWLRGAGFAAVVSGAGPTVLSLESVGADIRRDAAAAGWRVVPMGVAPQGVQITRGILSKVEF